MTKHWPRPRELSLLILLWRLYGATCFNLGEAVELLAPIVGGKKLVQRIIRSMVRAELLRRCSPLRYQARSPEELLSEKAAAYLAGRARRRGIEASIEGSIVRIEAEGETCEKAEKIFGALGYVVECYSPSSSS